MHDNVCKFMLWPMLPFEYTLKARTHMHSFFVQFFDIKVWWIFMKRLSKLIKFLLKKNVPKICLQVQDFKMEKAFHTKKPISYGKRVMVVMFKSTSMQEWQLLPTRFKPLLARHKFFQNPPILGLPRLKPKVEFWQLVLLNSKSDKFMSK